MPQQANCLNDRSLPVFFIKTQKTLYTHDCRIGVINWIFFSKTPFYFGKTPKIGLNSTTVNSAQSMIVFWESTIKTATHLARAFRRSNFPLVLSSAYRLFQKFVRGQARIRTYLSINKPPPDVQCSNPAIQTILHLKHVFNQTDCPISEFQYQFQTSLF